MDGVVITTPLGMLLLFSSVTLSISQSPHVSSYNRSTSSSVHLVMSRYATPIIDPNLKKKGGADTAFKSIFHHENV